MVDGANAWQRRLHHLQSPLRPLWKPRPGRHHRKEPGPHDRILPVQQHDRPRHLQRIRKKIQSRQRRLRIYKEKEIEDKCKNGAHRGLHFCVGIFPELKRKPASALCWAFHFTTFLAPKPPFQAGETEMPMIPFIIGTEGTEDMMKVSSGLLNSGWGSKQRHVIYTMGLPRAFSPAAIRRIY